MDTHNPLMSIPTVKNFLKLRSPRCPLKTSSYSSPKREITRPDHPRPVLTVERAPPLPSPSTPRRIQHALHDARRFLNVPIHRMRANVNANTKLRCTALKFFLRLDRYARIPARSFIHLSPSIALPLVVPAVLLRAVQSSPSPTCSPSPLAVESTDGVLDRTARVVVSTRRPSSTSRRRVVVRSVPFARSFEKGLGERGQGHAQSSIYYSHAYPHAKHHLGDRPPRADRSIDQSIPSSGGAARRTGLRASRGVVPYR